jgi:hypothetical protein
MTATISYPALRTRAAELFGVEYPVVQTGMGYVSTPGRRPPPPRPAVWGILGSGMDVVRGVR